MQPLRAPVFAASLILIGLVAAAPASTSAACGGGGFDQDALARRVGRQAGTIILGLLNDLDAEHAHHFELLEVYRGKAPSSPIERQPGSAGGIIDVGGCSGQHVDRGQRFVYAEGDRERYGPLQIVFPEPRAGRWIISHHGERASLDELLVLLGILPATSTLNSDAATPAGESIDYGWFIPAVAGLTVLMWVLGRREIGISG